MEGADKVLANLNKQIARLPRVTVDGLLAGGLIIQRDSQKRVPVEYGFLKASAYTRRSPDNAAAVDVGYSKKYAAAVHENTEMKWRGKPRKSGIGVYWGPKGEAQFLLKAVRSRGPEVLTAVAAYAQVRS